jgi:hypothetical protein
MVVALNRGVFPLNPQQLHVLLQSQVEFKAGRCGKEVINHAQRNVG